MNAEIAQYAAAVGAALADLPENTRNELMEDLPEHLAEVAAEAEAEGVTLADRLGPPAAYAAELRASLGHEVPERSARWSDRRARLQARLQPLNVRIGQILGYAQLTDLLRQLRPGWWVLRGYLAALVIAAVLGESRGGVVPEFGDNGVIGVLLIAGGVIGSVWLGRATTNGGRKTRIFSGVLSTGLALFAIGAVITVDGALTQGGYSGDQAVFYTAQSQPSDVIVVDPKGHPIGPVGIVDLDSQTYLNSAVHTCEGMLPWERERWPLLQVLCRETAQPSPSASPSPTVSPSVSAVPSPTR